MIAWLEKHLVPDWRDWWRMACNNVAALFTLVPGFIVAFDPGVLVSLYALVIGLPPGVSRIGVVMVSVGLLFAVHVFARLWQQGRADAE